jgi:hypothetical protein
MTYNPLAVAWANGTDGVVLSSRIALFVPPPPWSTPRRACTNMPSVNNLSAATSAPQSIQTPRTRS